VKLTRTADAKSMGTRRAVLGITLAAAVLGPANAATTAEPAMEQSLLAAMNAARAQNGVPPLKASPILLKAARRQSSYLLGKRELTHDSPGGKPFWTRIIAAGFKKNRPMAENLASIEGCGKTADQVVQLWLDSPAHRVNLLSTKYTLVGVASVGLGECSKSVYTTDFGG
jgi:uncharacterized protein YkwD